MTDLIQNGIIHPKDFSVIQWFAIYTKPRHEKRIAEFLLEKDIEAYVPLVKERHIWSDRKKNVEVPLIRGYVFVHIPAKYSIYVLQTNGVVRFVKFNQELAPIPDFQIEALKRTVTSGMEMQPREYLKTGEMVEVSNGPLKGIIGKIQRIENENHFIISLDAIQASYEVQVDPSLLVPVKKDDSKKTRITLPLGM